jgi:hypothetical protein
MREFAEFNLPRSRPTLKQFSGMIVEINAGFFAARNGRGGVSFSIWRLLE